MNLRRAGTVAEAQSEMDAQNLSRFSVPGFVIPASFIGDIGEQLEYGQGQGSSREEHSGAGFQWASAELLEGVVAESSGEIYANVSLALVCVRQNVNNYFITDGYGSVKA